jgi:hypothetical protein
VAVGTDGVATTDTDTGRRRLSQPLASVCETKKVKTVAVCVEKLGEADKDTPPVAAVYHFRFVPVAVKEVGLSPAQYLGELAIGGAGAVVITIFTDARKLSQPLAVWVTE